MKSTSFRNGLWVAISISIALFSANAAAQARKPITVEKARVVEYWTKERRAGAIPRDLVIDERGLGYLRHPDGSLRPYGHDVYAQEAPSTQTPSPFAKPGGGSGDTSGPTITDMDPAGGTIGASYTFAATVADPSGVRSVTFKIRKGNSTAQSFSATRVGTTDTWSVALSGFTDGSWSWWVVAKDSVGKGNSRTSATVNFTVSTGTGGGGGTVANAQWTAGGAVQTAAGRIYFEMPNNAQRTGPWSGYVCSGTVANDGTANRSIIITAAHCVYDDANKAFARNVLFIPNQAGTTGLGGTGTDLNCSNDPMGCWAPSLGVVDVNWTTRTFPDNVAWDYAYYVAPDTGAHSGTSAPSALDAAAGSLSVSFGSPPVNASGSADFTYALGYSYSEDPKFMYCAEDMTTTGTVNWWLASCGLSGGSSGGPWVQNGMNTWTGGTDGSIISVNSWGYTNQPGMAGPKLSGTSASCVFGIAKTEAFPTSTPLDGDEGKVVTACP